MKIRINNDYRMTSDSCNFILEKRGVKGKDTKTPGAETWSNIGYYGSIENLCVGLLKATTLGSEATNLSGLRADIQRVSASIVALVASMEATDGESTV